MRWLEKGGFAGEGDVRARVYMTSMTTCFPGRSSKGSGDRRPSAREVALCAAWLDGLLDLLHPRLVLPVGSLALARFLPGRGLDAAVGRLFDAAGQEVRALAPEARAGAASAEPPEPPALPLPPLCLPLPHPSGQSRWLNDPARMALLAQALELLPALVRWAESG
jgi:uracil-DNA glycosylase